MTRQEFIQWATNSQCTAVLAALSPKDVLRDAGGLVYKMIYDKCQSAAAVARAMLAGEEILLPLREKTRTRPEGRIWKSEWERAEKSLEREEEL